MNSQERESQSTVNQLTVQIQDLQDKVNSLNDSMEFNDSETASSAALSHVPSHPVSVPNLRGMFNRDSCLQPDIWNSFDKSGNAPENPLAPNEPPTAFFGNSRSSTSAQCEPVSLNTGRRAARTEELQRNTSIFGISTPRCVRKFST